MTLSRTSKKGDPFYKSAAWEAIRLKRLRMDGWRCQSCGVHCRGRKVGQSRPHVDHILERKRRPDLAMEISNLQTLCVSCHSKKTRNDQIAEGKPEIGIDGFPV